MASWSVPLRCAHSCSSRRPRRRKKEASVPYDGGETAITIFAPALSSETSAHPREKTGDGTTVTRFGVRMPIAWKALPITRRRSRVE